MDGVVRADAALGLEGRKLLVSGRGIRLLINKVDDREVTALGTKRLSRSQEWPNS